MYRSDDTFISFFKRNDKERKERALNSKKNTEGYEDKDSNKKDFVQNYVFDNLMNAAELYGHYKRLNAVRMDDGEKHRELSCRGGQKGVLGSAGTLVAGGIKEAKDLRRKLNDEEQIINHGGKPGVWADSGKDMKNNVKGIWHGFWNRNDDCETWSKKK